MPKMETLASTLQELATPGMKAKDIIAAVRERHSGASKKDVVRAAFFALTGGMDADPEKAKRIHELAITARTAEEDASSSGDKPRKAKRRRKVEAGGAQA